MTSSNSRFCTLSKQEKKPRISSSLAKSNKFYLLRYFSAQEDQAYELTIPDVGKISVYCHMSDAGLGECGGGGWTLVMKIDGNKVQ